MKKFIALVLFLFTLSIPFAVSAQTQPKCEGPADMCAQILDLQKQLDAQKAETAKVPADKIDAIQTSVDTQKSKSTKLIGVAVVLAIALKLLMSAVKGWLDFFKTDQGKAAIKSILLVLGFAAFILSNIGMGIPWWQALIVAGGPPGAILVHEIMDLIPVILGKKKLPVPVNPPTPDLPV